MGARVGSRKEADSLENGADYQMDFNKTETVFKGPGCLKSGIEFYLVCDFETTTSPKEVRQVTETLGRNVVESAVHYWAFGAIAGVIQNDDHGRHTEPGGCAQLHACHLKGPIADYN